MTPLQRLIRYAHTMIKLELEELPDEELDRRAFMYSSRIKEIGLPLNDEQFKELKNLIACRLECREERIRRFKESDNGWRWGNE